MTNLYQKQRIQRHLSPREKKAKKGKPDLILIIGDYEKECHTLVVTKASPVLEALRRWENGHDNIKIDFKTPFEAADLVMDFIYGYKLAIPESILSNVLRLSKFLLIDELADFCISQLKESELCVTSCLKTLFMCSLYDIEFERLSDFIRGNLLELLYKQDMLYIDESSIKYLLCDETLSYLPRFEWLRFVVQWCKFTTERKVLFPDLLKLIDLNKIRKSYLRNILQKEDLLEELPQCKEYFDQAIAKDDSEKVLTMVLLSSINKTFILDVYTGSLYRPFLQRLFLFQNTVFCNGFELGYVDMSHMKVYIGRMPIYPDACNIMSMEIQWCDDAIGKPPNIIQCLKSDDMFVFLERKRVRKKLNHKVWIKRFETVEIHILQEHTLAVLQAKPFLSFKYELNVKAVIMDNKLYLLRIFENKYYVHLIFLLDCRLITQEIGKCEFNFKTNMCIGIDGDILLETEKMKMNLNAESLEIKSVEYCARAPGIKSNIDKVLYSFSTIKRRIKFVNHSEGTCDFTDIPLTKIGQSSFFDVVMPVKMDQTGSLCHVRCPHCDPDIEIRDYEEYIRTMESQLENFYDDDDDFYDDFYIKDYDDYKDYEDFVLNTLDESEDDWDIVWW